MLTESNPENVDPFITLSKKLVNDSHRVRVAAHVKYGSLISQNGLEFWPIDKSRMNSGTVSEMLHEFPLFSDSVPVYIV
jgi:hypothetical protein